MQYDPGLIESVMIQISQNLFTLLSIKCTTVLKRIKYHPRISTLFLLSSYRVAYNYCVFQKCFNWNFSNLKVNRNLKYNFLDKMENFKLHVIFEEFFMNSLKS